MNQASISLDVWSKNGGPINFFVNSCCSNRTIVPWCLVGTIKIILRLLKAVDFVVVVVVVVALFVVFGHIIFSCGQ